MWEVRMSNDITVGGMCGWVQVRSKGGGGGNNATNISNMELMYKITQYR